MTSFDKAPRGKKSVEEALQFPDKTAFKTGAEYAASVKKYWKTIGRYRDLALELHEHIVKGEDLGPIHDNKKQDSKSDDRK